MKEEQIYNPVIGINRMISDIENLITPMIFMFQPVLRIIGAINTYLVIALFLGLLIHLVCIRKHRVKSHLKKSSMYLVAAIMLVIYLYLVAAPIRLGPYLNLSLAVFVMPLFAKRYGPVMACAFGLLQYMGMFVLSGGVSFSLSTMLLAAISGMIYGRILYRRRITYFRCFCSKLLVNIVCNVLFVPVLTGNVLTIELANAITQNIVSNIVLAPLQAAVIYYAFKLIKYLEKLRTED